MKSILTNVHETIKPVLHDQAIVIDATMGRGNDTLFLAQNAQRVFAFDIQKEALESTKSLLDSQGLTNVHLINDGHENMAIHIAESIDVIIFNFGYLPNGNHQITTQVDTSLEAIKQGLELLKVGGIMALTMYRGHGEGFKESKAIENYCQALNAGVYHVLKYQFINKTKSPYTLFIKKLRSEDNA